MREVRRVWDLMIELDTRPQIWVTTNGTVWSDRVEHYLRELQMGISMSIDGVDPDTIAAIRVGADPEQLLANRDRFLATIRSYGGEMKLNICVMPQNWREFLPYLLAADALDVDVYAARVHEPAEHSLFRLPPDDLADVLAEMQDQGRLDADRLGRNRPIWDDFVRQLAARLDEVAGTDDPSRAVPVGPPRRRRR